MLLVRPLAAAAALTWWLGGYALCFGVVLLAPAATLSRLRRELPSSGVPPRAGIDRM